MRIDNTLYWNIDDYDGKASYLEGNIMALQKFATDKEATPNEYRRSRKALIQLENEDEASNYGVTAKENNNRVEIGNKILTNVNNQQIQPTLGWTL